MGKRKTRPPFQQTTGESVGGTPLTSLNLPVRLVNLIENQGGFVFLEQMTIFNRTQLRSILTRISNSTVKQIALKAEAAGHKVPQDWKQP